jgi:hypothetical protein
MGFKREGQRQVMTDQFHFMTDEIHFMNDPTAAPNLRMCVFSLAE